MKRALPLKAGVATDPGQRRTNNEDLAFVNEREGLFLVVDGVGGEVAGEEAAKTAVDAIRFRFKDPGGDTEERIREAIALANNRIFQATQAKPELSGMACVLTLAVVEGRTVTIGHVGDTRLYRIRDGRMEKVTLDHSPVGEREDRGELTEGEAMAHPRRNEVYRDVGAEPHQPDDPGFIDIFRTSLPPDAALLMASDGLTDMVARDEILRIVESYDKDPQRTAEALVDAANEAGGKDNITVVFVPGSAFAPAAGGATTRRMVPAKPKRASAVSATPAAATAQQPSPPVRTAAPVESVSAHRPASRTRGIPIWAPLLIVAAAAIAILYLLQNRTPGDNVHLGPATLHVGPGRTYASITAALSAAKEGDSIIVEPGIYAENILLKSGVALIASKSREAQIQSSGTALNAQTITAARISGFRIGPDLTNTLQIGLMARDSAIEIADSEVFGASDAGVVIQGNSSARISGSFIHENSSAGVRVESAAAPDMKGNKICDNGVDIAPPSPLAAAANFTGPCSGQIDRGKNGKGTAAPAPARAEKGRPSGTSGARKGRRHE